jgi:hypothetical protein
LRRHHRRALGPAERARAVGERPKRIRAAEAVGARERVAGGRKGGDDDGRAARAKRCAVSLL